MRQPESIASAPQPDSNIKLYRPPSATDATGMGGYQTSSQTHLATGLKKFALFSLGAAFLLIGGLGAILPGLPATPFLLLASFFFVRSSPRLNAWLLRSRFFGPILVDWQVHGGVRADVRVKAIVVVIFAVALTIYVSGFSLLPALILISLAAIGVVVILSLPAARRP